MIIFMVFVSRCMILTCERKRVESFYYERFESGFSSEVCIS